MSSDVAELEHSVSSVPAGWAQATLGDIISLEYGKSLPDKSRRPGHVPVYGSNGVVGWHDEPLVATGGIIVGRKGTAGSVTVSADPFWPIDTTYFVKPRQKVDWEWLAATLHHARLKELNEATGVPGLNRDKAYLQPILIPPLDEQRRIADVLRSVDEAIARTKVAVEQASHAIQGMLQRLFVEGIGHSDFKDGHSTPIPASWDEKSLGDLSATPVTYGVVQPGPNVADGIPFVRGGDFPNGTIDIGSLRKIGADVASQYRRTQLKGGEIVVSLVGYPGACAIVPAELAGANIARQAALIRPGKEVAANYLYQFLRSPIGQDRLKKETIGSAQQVINLRDLKEVFVALPPIHEQVQIAAILADLDAFVELETANLAKLTALKGSIAADLLSGRVGVPA